MKSIKKSKSNLRSGMDEGMELSGIGITKSIFDLMIRETFAMFDEDNSGDIDKAELSKLTEVLGLDKKSRDDIMTKLDKEGNDSIDFQEYKKQMEKYPFGNAETHLETAFNEYDKDMDGEIGIEDLLKVSEELDEVSMSKADAELMIAFFKYFAQEQMENEGNINNEEINSINITKREFLIYLKGVI